VDRITWTDNKFALADPVNKGTVDRLIGNLMESGEWHSDEVMYYEFGVLYWYDFDSACAYHGERCRTCRGWSDLFRTTPLGDGISEDSLESFVSEFMALVCVANWRCDDIDLYFPP